MLYHTESFCTLDDFYKVFETFYRQALKDAGITNRTRYSAYEKAKIILYFFLAQDWIPIFEPFLDKNDNEDDYQDRIIANQSECDEYNRLFDVCYQRIQLERQLFAIEQQLEHSGQTLKSH